MDNSKIPLVDWDVGLVWTLGWYGRGRPSRSPCRDFGPVSDNRRRNRLVSDREEKAHGLKRAKKCQYIHEAFRQHFSGSKADFVNAFQPSKLSLFGPILGWISDAASKTSVALIFLVARTIRYYQGFSVRRARYQHKP